MSKVSIIIRTKNEAHALPACLDAIDRQTFTDYEIIVVDSGSTDNTVAIAQARQCQILTMPPEQFTFGRSLNIGIDAAQGEIMVIISAHCLPANEFWLEHLIEPFAKIPKLAGVYGRQVPFSDANPIERRGLLEAFPSEPTFRMTIGNRFSNANSAISKSVWLTTPFDENLSGAEDIDWCAKVQYQGWTAGYEPRSQVYHSHQESLRGVYKRFYRETLALQAMNSELVHKHSVLGYIGRWLRAVLLDYWFLLRHPISLIYFIKWFFLIPIYRIGVYYGQYRGTR